MIVRNHRELFEAYRTEQFGKFFITPDAEGIIKASLECNVQLLVDAYGDSGSGGYIRIIPSSIDTEDGANEYLAELAKFNLTAEMCEFDDTLVQFGAKQIHLQMFAMTEYNLLLLYIKKGG